MLMRVELIRGSTLVANTLCAVVLASSCTAERRSQSSPSNASTPAQPTARPDASMVRPLGSVGHDMPALDAAAVASNDAEPKRDAATADAGSDAGMHADAEAQSASDAAIGAEPVDPDQLRLETQVIAAQAGYYATAAPGQDGVLTGTDLGWAFAHRDRIWVMFGDSWWIDPVNAASVPDDALGQISLTDFPDGPSVDAFVREHPAPPGQPAWRAAGPTMTVAQRGNSGFAPVISVRDGEQLPAPGLCQDRATTVYDPSSDVARALSVVLRHNVGVTTSAAPLRFEARAWDTVRFSNATSRTVSDFDPERAGGAGNDYTPAHGNALPRSGVFVWGRPGFGGIGVDGRDAQLYLLWAPMPEPDADLRFAWAPRYFTGVDAEGRPQFSPRQVDARPLDLDAATQGDQPEEVHDVVGQWLGRIWQRAGAVFGNAQGPYRGPSIVPASCETDERDRAGGAELDGVVNRVPAAGCLDRCRRGKDVASFLAALMTVMSGLRECHRGGSAELGQGEHHCRLRSNGSRRTRCCASSTTTIAPTAIMSLDCASTSRSRSITRSVRVSCNRKTITLVARSRVAATISPKSRSNVRTTRPSAAALAKISGSAMRWSCSSRR
jgi:hypothetical protein